MSLTISLIVFDINFDEIKLELNKQNFFSLPNNKDFSSPINMIKNFLSYNNKAKLIEVKKTSSKIKINFSYQINEKKLIIFNIIILHDFSRIYNICLSSDGYIIFLNSENKKIKDNLDNIIEYIKDSCDIETKTFIINVYKNQNLSEKKNNIINNYLDKKELRYNYYQMKYMDDNINNINNDEIIDDDNDFENIENDDITFEKLLRIVYDNKIKYFSGVSLKYCSNSGSGNDCKCLIY